MVLNTFALVFVLGITFMHSLFGLHSGLINVFCSVTALSVAFGFVEPLNNLLTGSFHLPSMYTEPLALVLLFVITLLVLRLLADTYLRGNVHVPMYLDWGGGALCGFINAQIAVGVMVISFLLLPFGGRVMMFSRYERDPDNKVDPDTGRVEFHRNNLWFRSDDFAIGLFKLLSNGSLKGESTFASVYPDYSEWVFWSGNQVQLESLPSPLREENSDGFDEKGLGVETWWEQKSPIAQTDAKYRKKAPGRDDPNVPFEPMAYRLRAGNRLVGVRLKLMDSSADREKSSATHRFRPTMIRLVGDIKQPDGSRVPCEYDAQIIGGADERVGNSLRIVDMDANFSVKTGGQKQIDVYFEVDKDFEPRFVEYRRHARAPLNSEPAKSPPADRGGGGATPAQPAAAAQTPAQPNPAPAQGSGSGVARFIDAVVRENTGDNDRLPFSMARTKLGGDAEVQGSLFISGRVSGERSALASAPTDAVDKFKIPEGKRILQVQVHTRKMQSLLGEVLNFAASTVNQYQAVERGGTPYPLAGYYALVHRGGAEYIELFFTPTPEESGYNGMLDFKDTGIRRELREQDDSILGLLFVVPPGKTFVAIKSQGGTQQFGEDITVRN